jgi:hypothetical protein
MMNRFELQRQEAINRLKTLIGFGMRPDILEIFESGEVPCVLPAGVAPVKKHRKFSDAVKVFNKIYSNDGSRKPLVYCVLPFEGVVRSVTDPTISEKVKWLNVLFVQSYDTDEEEIENGNAYFKPTIYNDMIDIPGYVFNTFVTPNDIGCGAALMEFGDFGSIYFKINNYGMLYRVA